MPPTGWAGRELSLEGCLNLRDLGGKASVDGRRVRDGCLFRSDELCSLTPADIKVIGELGIRVVFDLRNHVERTRRPNRVPRVRPLLEARRPVLASALNHLHDRWGGYDGYAVEALGVAPGVVERVRQTLLVD